MRMEAEKVEHSPDGLIGRKYPIRRRWGINHTTDLPGGYALNRRNKMERGRGRRLASFGEGHVIGG
jgi:hypothetical protein